MKTSNILFYALIAFIAYKVYQKLQVKKATKSQGQAPENNRPQSNQEVANSNTADEPAQVERSETPYFDVGEGFKPVFEREDSAFLNVI